MMKRILGKIVDVRPEELRAVLLGFVFNFVVLGSYYVIRPIRDDIAAAGAQELEGRPLGQGYSPGRRRLRLRGRHQQCTCDGSGREQHRHEQQT